MRKVKKRLKYRSLSILAVVNKDIKTIFRSKSSAFAIILGPLLVMLLVGMAFNNSSLFDINVGTYSDSYSELTNQIINQLESRNYVITKTNGTIDCLRGVKNGEYNVCAVFPENMVVSNNASSIIFYVDQSRINIVHTIMAEINEEVLKKSYNISLELTNTIIDQLFATGDVLSNSLVLIGSVTENQNNIQSTTKETKNKAASVDLSLGYEMFEIPELKSAFADVVGEYNISDSDENSVQSQIKLTDAQIKYTLNKVTDANNKLIEISGNLDNMFVLINSNIENTITLEGDLRSTASDIDSIVVTNPESIVRPINTEIKPLAAQKTHIGRFLPTFIILIILFVSVLLSSSLILSERTSSAYFRNTISTTPPYIFLIGTYLTSFIIVLLQLVIIAIGLDLIVGFNLNLLSALIIPLLLIISMFILLGIVVGYFTSSQETANVISLFLIVGALFFSNTILPLEALPSYLKQIVLYNPFVVGEFAVKKMLVFGFVLSKVKSHIFILIWYNLIFLILSYLGLVYSKKKVMER